MSKNKEVVNPRKAESVLTTYLRRTHGRDIFANNLQELIHTLPIGYGLNALTLENLLRQWKKENLIRLRTFKETHPVYPAGLTRIRLTQKGRQTLNVPYIETD